MKVFSSSAQLKFDSIAGISNFTMDLFGKCYAIQGSEILKINENGSIVKTFSNKEFGNPTLLDARDPLRLLVFYRDFGVIRILDNQMAEQSSIDLRQLGYSDVRLISGSVDQGIWIYDHADAQLIKLDIRLQRNLIAVDMRQLLGKEINPSKMEQSKFWLAMQNGKEILIFDNYGTYVKTITLEYDPILFEIDENLLLTGTKDSIEFTNLSIFNSGIKIKAFLPEGAVKASYFKEQFRYIKSDYLFLPKL